MRVCIFGAGVIGGILASAVQRSGHETSVIARGETLRAIEEHGLHIQADGETATTRPCAVDDPKKVGPQDLVIVATKTTSFRDVAAAVPLLLHSQTLVAFAANGIFWFYGEDERFETMGIQTERLDPEGLLHRNIGAERALGIICVTGGKMSAPGVVQASRRDGHFIAGAARASARENVESVLRALNPADIRFDITSDIRRAMWVKYLSVVGNHATCALTGATIGQVHADPALQSVQLSIVDEAHRVALAHGFSDLGFDKERWRANPAKTPHKPSMLQDLERGRALEIESTYMILQDLARQQGVATPTLDILVALLQMRARTAGCET